MLARQSSLLLALLLVAAGCAGPADRAASGPAQSGPAAASSGPKRIATVMRGNPFTLSQAVNSAGSGSVPGVDELQALVHAGLGIEDDQRQVRPHLAVELPSIENGLWKLQPDGRMETTWKLKQDIRWQDGTPLTADDLTFTVRVGQDKRVSLAGHSVYSLIDEVSAPDKDTLTVTWSQPYTKADLLLTHSGSSDILPLPRHILESAYTEDATTLTELPYWTTEFVGLGPFKLKEFFEGSHMLLTASDQFFLGRPKIDEIEVKFMPDPSTIAANILSGAVELTLGGRFSIEWGAQIRDQWTGGRMEAPVATSWVALFPQFINPQPRSLLELPMRRALTHAVDRKEMSDTIQEGLSPVGHGIVGPHDPEFKEVESSIVHYDHDPRAAAQLIEGLGYAKGPDGVYRDAGGERLTMEIRTRQGDDLQEKTLFGVAGYWQRVGVAAEPLVFPPQRAPDREFRSTRPGFEVVRQPSGEVAVTRYHGKDTPLPDNNYRGVNRTRYQNAELDAMLDRYVSTIPRQQRLELLGRIVNHLTDNAVVTGIYWALDPTMIGNRLVNVSPRNPTWNAHLWDVNR